MKLLRTMVLLLLCAGLGCAQELMPVTGQGDYKKHELPIINGTPPTAPEHQAVVGLHEVSGKFLYTKPFCSGTLITPTVVLTAAHCLVRSSPAKVRVYVGNNPAEDLRSHLYEVTEITTHPQYSSASLRNDIALARLASPVTEAAPVPSLPGSLGFTSGDVGARLNFAGFGKDETGANGVKLQVDGVLGGLGCSVSGCPSPGDATTMISYAQQESGPCSGDSGGPAFLYRDGTPYVAGITSYGDAACVVYGVSTRTDAFEGYIQAFAGGPAPNCSTDGFCNPDCSSDADCGGSSSCGNGTCDAGESCDGRNGTLACSDCAGRTGGKPAQRYCYVNGACVGGGCP